MSDTQTHFTHGVLNCYVTLSIIATVPVRSVSVLAMMLPRPHQALLFLLPLSLAWLPQNLDSSSFLGLLETPWSTSPWNRSPMLEKRARETRGSWAPRGTLNSVEDLWDTFIFTLSYKLGFSESMAAAKSQRVMQILLRYITDGQPDERIGSPNYFLTIIQPSTSSFWGGKPV